MQRQKCREYFKKKLESRNTYKKGIDFFGSWLEISIFQTSFTKSKSQTNGRFSQ